MVLPLHEYDFLIKIFLYICYKTKVSFNTKTFLQRKEKPKMLLNNIGAVLCSNHPPRPDPVHKTRLTSSRFHHRRDPPPSPAKVHWKKRDVKQQSICTADELHHISIPNSDWKLALWRYLPSPEVCKFSTL